MKNEPVAWMQTWENQDGKLKHTVNIEQIGKNDIPLYTHPAKTLTDEEIKDIAKEWGTASWYAEIGFGWENFCDCVKAILRKAQEK